MEKKEKSDADKAAASERRKEMQREKGLRNNANLSAAFEQLKQQIPYLRADERKRLPHIKTLRLAMQYIEHLRKLVDGNEVIRTEDNQIRPLTHFDFCHNVKDEMRIRNFYGERARCEEVQRTVPKEKHSSISIEPEKQDIHQSNNVCLYLSCLMLNSPIFGMAHPIPVTVPVQMPMHSIQSYNPFRH